jgi:hypothetical protein
VQAVPQAPQLLGSKLVFVQTPPHAVCPEAQLAEQTPAVHAVPDAQGVVQAPQCSPSVCRSTQSPPQFTCEPGHDTEQAPALQTCPLAHVAPPLPPETPQPAVAPQWRRSVLGSTHAPLQFTCVPGHDTEHAPALHTWPLAHVAPATPPETPQPAVAPQWI